MNIIYLQILTIMNIQLDELEANLEEERKAGRYLQFMPEESSCVHTTPNRRFHTHTVDYWNHEYDIEDSHWIHFTTTQEYNYDFAAYGKIIIFTTAPASHYVIIGAKQNGTSVRKIETLSLSPYGYYEIPAPYMNIFNLCILPKVPRSAIICAQLRACNHDASEDEFNEVESKIADMYVLHEKAAHLFSENHSSVDLTPASDYLPIFLQRAMPTSPIPTVTHEQYDYVTQLFAEVTNIIAPLVDLIINYTGLHAKNRDLPKYIKPYEYVEVYSPQDEPVNFKPLMQGREMDAFIIVPLRQTDAGYQPIRGNEFDNSEISIDGEWEGCELTGQIGDLINVTRIIHGIPPLKASDSISLYFPYDGDNLYYYSEDPNRINTCIGLDPESKESDDSYINFSSLLNKNITHYAVILLLRQNSKPNRIAHGVSPYSNDIMVFDEDDDEYDDA